MAGTPEGGKKAAETRGHESLSQAGRKGGEHSHGGKGGGTNEKRSSKQEEGSKNK